MRYHYEKPKEYISVGERYVCNHLIYTSCTLFRDESKGLAVIQQRFDKLNKSTYWTEIDPWIASDLYLHSGFGKYFSEHAKGPVNDIYPTVTVRQIMWSLKMKPLKKERWETVFDRKDI